MLRQLVIQGSYRCGGAGAPAAAASLNVRQFCQSTARTPLDFAKDRSVYQKEVRPSTSVFSFEVATGGAVVGSRSCELLN
jgi:hypothetical protein